jgi:hypothetical protein
LIDVGENKEPHKGIKQHNRSLGPHRIGATPFVLDMFDWIPEHDDITVR